MTQHYEEEVRLLSFAESANVLFIKTPARIFTIELHSERVRNVCEEDNDDDDDDDSCSLVPIEGFYTPLASQDEEGEHTTNFICSSSCCIDKEKRIFLLIVVYSNDSSELS
jgi:hypothetical protein